MVTIFLAGVCTAYLPDLARDLQSLRLVALCGSAALLIFGVPLMQAIWHTSYARALASVVCALVLVGLVSLGYHMALGTSAPPVARPAFR